MTETRTCPRCRSEVALGPVGVDPENYAAHIEAHEAGYCGYEDAEEPGHRCHRPAGHPADADSPGHSEFPRESDTAARGHGVPPPSRPERRAEASGAAALVKTISRLRLQPGESLLVTVDHRHATADMLEELHHILSQILPSTVHVVAVPDTVAVQVISPETAEEVEGARSAGPERPVAPGPGDGRPSGISDISALVKPQFGLGR